MKVEAMICSAALSDDRKYRYELRRIWNPEGMMVAFIGLNPSTADEQTDDPTIRRCVGYARDWGYGGLIMLNLFAYRSTDPKALYGVDDPIGPDNNAYIISVTGRQVACTVAAWGAGGVFLGRDDKVREIVGRNRLHVLGLTRYGSPKHPLYLKKDLKPVQWESLEDAKWKK